MSTRECDDYHYQLIEDDVDDNDDDADNSIQLHYKQSTIRQCKRLGVRHLQTVLLFFLLVIAYGHRVNLSVAIVAMTDKSSPFESYDWDERTRSLILSSFFWGYIVTQIPAGQLARKYGSKTVLSWTFGCSSILATFTHLATHHGNWQALCATRALQGITQGFIFTCTHNLLSKWVPPQERARLAALVYSGAPLGTVFALAISGVIASSPLGWPSIFYVFGGLGLLWTIVWAVYGSESPERDRNISGSEKQYIQSSLGQITDSDEIKKIQTPWKAIFTSLPFISLLLAHCAQNWGFWILLTEIPSYLKYTMGFDIQSNALLSALPYLVMYVVTIIMSFLSDWLLNRNLLSVGQCRKLFNSIGIFIPMIALLGLGYVSVDSPILIIVLLTVCVGVNGATYVGYMLNHMDLSPVHAGTLMGITNFCANIMSIMGPLFVGAVVTDSSDPTLWRLVFFTAAGFYLIGNTLFIIFGRGSIQHWNCDNSRANRNHSTEL